MNGQTEVLLYITCSWCATNTTPLLVAVNRAGVGHQEDDGAVVWRCVALTRHKTTYNQTADLQIYLHLKR